MEINDKLQKLLELSKRGVGGEKENATILLNKLMKKYHITEEELNTKKKEWYKFQVKNEWETKLLFQIIYALYGYNSDISYSRKSKKTYYIELTAEQKIETEYAFSIYKNDFYTEMESFLTAFIYKNDLFPEDAPTNKNPGNYDYDKAFRIQSYMSGIKRSNVKKAIGTEVNK